MLLGENHIGPVLDAQYMERVSDKFATCSTDGTIRLWDANDYTVYARCMIAANTYPNCAVFTEEIILSGWSDSRVRAFRVDTQDLLWTIDNAHKDGVSCIDLSYNFKFLVTGGGGGDIRVWEVRTREMISHLKEHTSRVTEVEILPDDMHLVSCSRDKTLLTWDLKSEKRLTSHSQPMGGMNQFCRRPGENSKFVTVGQERMITFWDLAKVSPEGQMNSSPYQGESDELFSVDCSPDGRYFATGGSLGIL